MSRLLPVFLLISGLGALSGQSQTVFPDATAPETPPDATASPSGSAQPSSQPAPNLLTQKVGSEDLLSVAVADLPEMTRSFRVGSDGTLSLPLVKEKIQAGGKTTPEIEQEISEALIREQILVSPVVSVVVTEYHSLPVSVLGAVKNPVTFQAAGEVHLLDALTRAGGLTPDAGADILVSRPGKNGAPAVTQRISVRQLVYEADPELNVRLSGGEEVRVPLAGRVFVLGNVKKSGAFPIEDNGDLSVLKVLAESEGLMPFTSKLAYIYRREAGGAARTEIPIPLRQILERKSPDVPLQSNDILYVPDDKHKRITAEALERAAGFGVATASGFLVFH